MLRLCALCGCGLCLGLSVPPSAPPRRAKVVLLRHGETLFNRKEVFTGWCDVPLTNEGKKQAWAAGAILDAHGVAVDTCFCSVLERASGTAWRALEGARQSFVPVLHDWRLNERMYGSLQGLSKGAMAEALGEEVVYEWRKKWRGTPPAMTPKHPHYELLHGDRRYAGIAIPDTESVADTAVRVAECWREKVLPQVQAGDTVLVVAHRNSLRALVQYLDDLPEEAVESLAVPTGVPFAYTLDCESGEVVRPEGVEAKTFSATFFANPLCMGLYEEKKRFLEGYEDQATASYPNFIAAPEECQIEF